MFSRTWHGAVPMKHKAGFEKYEYETGVRDTQKIKGNRGAYLKVVENREYAHFFLCTLWDSMESMLLYAGEKPEIAVDYPEDSKYELISDPIVVIQEVTTINNPFTVYDNQ
ncbi:MAG TPA: hypothetical protein VJY54_04925 [Lachnospiraceae bacterium]|nr:hypothetical protein [Lachnospiraceae bacterium]